MIVGLCFNSTANAEVQIMVIKVHAVAVERWSLPIVFKCWKYGRWDKVDRWSTLSRTNINEIKDIYFLMIYYYSNISENYLRAWSHWDDRSFFTCLLTSAEHTTSVSRGSTGLTLHRQLQCPRKQCPPKIDRQKRLHRGSTKQAVTRPVKRPINMASPVGSLSK